MASLTVHHSSAKHDWRTPGEVIERVRTVAPIGLDPCASREGSVGARVELHEGDDGLAWGWCRLVRGDEVVYVNSPYGRALAAWMSKCASEAETGISIIALTPARTDTRWLPWDSQAICFWRGRLTFEGASAPAPFPSALMCWSMSRRVVGAFDDAFGTRGQIVYPGGAA